MMKNKSAFRFHFSSVLFFLFFVCPLAGQERQWVLADTLEAKRLYADAIALNRQGQNVEAYARADIAQKIWEMTIGKNTKEVSDALHQKGNSYYFQGLGKEAISLYEQSLKIRLDILGTEHPDVAKTCNNLGGAYLLIGAYQKAIDCHNRALNIWVKREGYESLNAAQSYYNLGLTHEKLGKYDETIGYYLKESDIYFIKLGADHPKILESYLRIGNAYFAKKDYFKSIEYDQKVLDKKIELLGQDDPEVASAFLNVGISYFSIGEYNKANYYIQKSVGILMKNPEQNKKSLASTYLNYGTLLDAKGEYKQALEYKKKALSLQIDALGYEDLDAAATFNNIGYSYFLKGEYEKAIDYYNKSLGIRLQKMQPNHPDIAESYDNLSVPYFAMAQDDKEMEYKLRALEIRLKTLDPNHPDLARSYNNLGVSHQIKGEYDKSIEYFQKGEQILINAFGPEHPDLVKVYKNKAVSYRYIKKYDLAFEYFKKSISIQSKALDSGDSDLVLVNIYDGLAELYVETKSYFQADSIYQLAFSALNYNGLSYNQVKSISDLIAILSDKARFENSRYVQNRNQAYLHQSYHSYHEAINAYDYQVKTQSETDHGRFAKIFANATSVNLELYHLTNSIHYQHETFAYTEAAKALSLRRAMQAADAIAFAGIPDSLLQREHDFRIDITWREKQRQSLLEKGLSDTDTTVLRISGILFDLKRDYETLQQRFETEYPEYYRLKYDFSTVSLQYTQDTLLSPNQTLLEYFTGDSSIFLFVVKKHDYKVLEIKRDFPLDSLIRDLRDGITRFHTDPAWLRRYDEATALYTQAAHTLYEKLLAPAEPLLTREVIIVPDGALAYIPFEALLSAPAPVPQRVNFSQLPYWIRNHNVSYAYSATLLREMRERRFQKIPERMFLGMAPTFAGDTTGIFTDYIATRKGHNPLKYNAQEVRDIQKIFGGQIITAQDASESRFLQEAANYRIVHLSTHGKADDRNGDYSYLVFYENEDSEENELLYVREIYNLALNAELVTLSACETNLGQLQRGEGVISLARAFAYAGAKSIVTSLWSVSDERSKDLMVDFYRNLKAGKTKDTALADAKRAFIDAGGKEGAHPFFWAAFIGVGDMGGIGD